MSKLKDHYINIEHQYDRIENTPWYLSELALQGAIEISNHIHEKTHDFEHIQELVKILEKYQLKDTDTVLTEPHFPYLPLGRAVRKNSDKDIRWMSELALEMRLLRSELSKLKENPATYGQLKEMQEFLGDFSTEFLIEYDKYNHPHRLVA